MMRLADNIPGKPHRWADAIGAWARGELVQWRYASTEATDADWRDCDYPSRGMPNWSYPGIEYRAALSSHHEDGGRAEPVWCSCGDAIMPDTGAKCGVCASGVALGGEKGEAVAWGVFAMVDGAMTIQYPVALSPAGAKEHAAMYDKKERVDILPLFASPVGKARMLTDEEADHITGMHNTGRSQGDSECAEAIQRKFCEVNGITLEGGNRSRG